WRTALAIAVSFGGVLVRRFDPLVTTDPLALAFMLLAAPCLADGAVLVTGLRGLAAFAMQAWPALVATFPLLAISAWLEPGALAALPSASWVAWVGVAYAAFISSLLGHGLYYVLVQKHPVAQVTPWLLLVPVLAVGLGIAFWGDRPGPRLFIGGAMVLGGVLGVALRALQKARSLPPTREV